MQRKNTTEILKKLRAVLANREVNKGRIYDAIIVSCKDTHHNRNLAPCDERLWYISGFYGQYGTAVVTAKHANLWTDNRFVDQARLQTDKNWTVYQQGIGKNPSFVHWLKRNLQPGAKVASVGTHITLKSFRKLETALRYHSIDIDAIDTDLVALIWKDRPPMELKPLSVQPLEFSGKTILAKLQPVWDAMKSLPASVLFVHSLSEVAWLLNLRGNDVPWAPLFFAYLIILDQTFILFTDVSRITLEIRAHLDKEMPLPYKIEPYEKVLDAIRFYSGKLPDFTWVALQASYATCKVIPENKLYVGVNPVSMQRIIKTESEIKGMKNAAIREGAALCCTLQWLEETVRKRPVPETEVVKQLDTCRKEHELFAFAGDWTNVSFGSNTIIKHYVPKAGMEANITRTDIVKIRAGGQYRDGSTHITRIFHFGTPTDVQKTCFTKVLKGGIGLTTAVFPNRSKGSAIDAFARKFIWESGVDYDFRTGHGVGCFLKIHDNILEISKFSQKHQAQLQPDMCMTIEPVYPLDNCALSCMNVVLTKKADPDSDVFLAFESISMCPVQKKMIDMELITSKERQSLNHYHENCRKAILPLLEKMGKKAAADWLVRNTEPINIQEAIYAF